MKWVIDGLVLAAEDDDQAEAFLVGIATDCEHPARREAIGGLRALAFAGRIRAAEALADIAGEDGVSATGDEDSP